MFKKIYVNNIMNLYIYICLIFFGIILYLLWNHKDKFSIGGQQCTSINAEDICIMRSDCTFVDMSTTFVTDMKCLRSSINWFTTDNEYYTEMIPNIHNQGECDTCSLYSIIYIFECMYNISKRNEDPNFNPISISPQSLIDIFGRYHSKIIPCSNEDYYSHGTLTSYGCNCTLMRDGFVDGHCGYNWLCSIEFHNINTLLHNFAKLKTLDKDKFSSFNFSYPLIKESSVRNDNIPYQTINNCYEGERILFNELSEIIQEDDYLYTDHFNPDDLIDFHFNWDRIFILNTVLSYNLETYKNMLKEKLNRGPVLVNIAINPDYNPYDEKGQTNKILNDNILRNMLINHSITIVGYDNDNIILLNSWKEDVDLIDNCTFEELYNCHEYTIANNPIIAFLEYNYVYIDLYTDKKDEEDCYNPGIIQRYISSCGSIVPSLLATTLGITLFGIIFYKNKSKICPCLNCAAAPVYTEMYNSGSDLESDSEINP